MYQNCYPGPLYTQVPSQPLPCTRPSYISGRVVNKVEDIAPNEVPMDGSSGLFPLSDLSAVFIKAWNSDGTIRTTKYVPEVIKPVEVEEKPSEIEELKTWLDSKFNSLSKSCGKPANGRKEDKPNE